jgi:alcohol dehydrogenase class IV
MTIAPFIFTGLPTRVIFGNGRMSETKAEAERLGMKAPMIVTGRQQAALGASLAKRLGAAHFDGARMHTPTDVTDRAMAFFAARQADGVIALGGGSSIGLGKALALRTGCPQIAIPTTYAGSEMTPILGETADGVKTTKRDPKIQPETVIYDPDLTVSLPLAMSATSGINAIAHAVEALYAKDGNPVISLMAEEGIRALASALPDVTNQRSEALYGAWLCGAVLGVAGMALHHKLCHVLGGSFNLPHAETHTVILPHATAFNAAATPQAMNAIARALGEEDAAMGLHKLAKRLNAPVSLKELGMNEKDLPRAVELAIANPYWNPQAVTEQGIARLLDNAFHGRQPAP